MADWRAEGHEGGRETKTRGLEGTREAERRGLEGWRARGRQRGEDSRTRGLEGTIVDWLIGWPVGKGEAGVSWPAGKLTG